MTQYESGDRINQFGGHSLSLVATITVVGVLLFFSTSPTVGLGNVAIFLLAAVGLAAIARRLSGAPVTRRPAGNRASPWLTVQSHTEQRQKE